ncbi:OmpW family outer membrane protein [Rheinheimera soli]|uniref:Outer membrane protein n=1 Tax=Rheinheimera soli TaxID=443616 RepID=A0ABU1VXM5_9GAMM|nr:OmpW family outer membrane protein [Rheinheimera soli]MDR7120340.1 outer membrane protein [Rheinheimera soli]
MKTSYKTIASLVLAVSAAPALANWSVNVGAITVAPQDSSSHLNVVETVAGLPANSTELSVNNNTQLGITIDYQLNKNWTIELIAATPFSHDIQVKGSAINGLPIGSTKHLPPTLLAQYHFDLGNSRFDPFIGLGLNYTTFFQEEVSGELVSTLQALNVTDANDKVQLKLKDSVGLAMQAGVNIKLADSWSAHLMLSKMDIETEGRVQVNGTTIQSVDVTIDPYVWMIGARYSF